MKKLNLICAYDALCGWCFGFGPVLLHLQEEFAGQLDFEMISGGMITGASAGPLANMAGFIRNAYPVVEQHTGIRFGEGFLKNLDGGNVVFRSLEPGNVLTVVKQLKPEVQVAAAHQIQCLIYRDGINPVDYLAYKPIFDFYELDWKTVSGLLSSSETASATVNEFAQIQKWKIQGFPACILEDAEGNLTGISSGFLPAKELTSRLRNRIQEKQAEK